MESLSYRDWYIYYLTHICYLSPEALELLQSQEKDGSAE